MRIKSKDLLGLRVLADDIKDRAGRLQYNVRFRRVTHTLISMVGIIKSLVSFRNATETPKAFVKRLEFVLYQSQIGPTEIIKFDVGGQGQIFIQGTFSIERLRSFIIVNEPDPELSLEVVEAGK